ncbi:hypothetical protein C2G38_2111771 [Gigaspora rosea]|uniref:Cytochrome b5 heme-binding domain-containing protein n=1 Tax=Gigaspora rosea TaxID=44941 RepID=A0A397UEW0_9GLOM|nr:hypothetical protein C2G38_2111771 [Gigaspora rosea]
MSNQVIFVGGGLSGLSAAHTVLERGGNVLVLDKNSFFGCNSTKATWVLTGNSASVVEFLQEKFKLDLSLVSRLGGHSEPRTLHIEEIANNQPDRARLIKKARVTKLIKEGDAIIDVEYVIDGQTYEDMVLLFWLLGGYAADFTEDHLLKKYRPDIYNLPTTNGEYSTVPDTKIKFLAAEALRSVGGLLLNGEGKRFCDELVKLQKKLNWHFKHYVGRGLMRKFSDESNGKINQYFCITTKGNDNDIASNKRNDPFGKKFFHNVQITINDQFHVALMSPGRIYINAELGGSSLLGCVVYGRVSNLSGATANRYLGQIVGQLAPYQTIVSVTQQIKSCAQTREKKEYTAEEVVKHNKVNGCWVIVFKYDPGGKKSILIYAGKDATEEHSLESIIGTLKR